jgi:hypothetical protein
MEFFIKKIVYIQRKYKAWLKKMYKQSRKKKIVNKIINKINSWIIIINLTTSLKNIGKLEY